MILSKTHTTKNAQRGGNLFTSAFNLARPFILPAAKALATTGLSCGAEKLLKRVFGSNIGSQEIQLYKLVQAMNPSQNKAVENLLIGQEMVHGGGAAKYGGSLGMLASIGVTLAFDLVSKLIGEEMHVRSCRTTSDRGGGTHAIPFMRPPPFFGSLGEKLKFRDVLLSNAKQRAQFPGYSQKVFR